MTLDEAIIYVEEAAIEEEKLCKRYDAASGFLRSHNESIRTSDAKKCEKRAEELRQFAEWFKGLKQLMEQAKWIPVKERLPENTDYYLIQYSRKICPDEKAVAFYSVEEKESDPDYDWEFTPQCGEYKEVLAWMPLPYDYKEENEQIYCSCTNEEIAKSFIDSVETVKDLLPKSEGGVEEMNAQQMEFPETFEEFAEYYGFKDDKEIYTNGSDLIPIFRVKQWLDHDNKLRALEADTAYEYGKYAVNKWIPVSERLPEDRDWYLGIFKEPDTGWINHIPFVCCYVGSETKATTKEFWILRGITDIDNSHDYYKNLECVAWTLLPEQYNAEREE